MPKTLLRHFMLVFPLVCHPCVLNYDVCTSCIVSIHCPRSSHSSALSMLCPQYKHQEIERVDKWVKMVKNWNRYHNSEKVSATMTQLLWAQMIDPNPLIPIRVCVMQMKKRVYKGIPMQLRGQAWALLLELEKVKQQNEGKYEVRDLSRM